MPVRLQLIKKSHTFFWAATPTCSNGLGDTLRTGENGVDGRPLDSDWGDLRAIKDVAAGQPSQISD